MTKTRYVPNGYKQFTPDIGDYPKDMFACYVDLSDDTKPKAIFYIGKQTKAKWHYSFRDVDSMKNKIKDTISNLMSYEDLKADRKLKRIEARKNMDVSTIKTGDIYRWGGGYNCSRNAYIKVIGVAGKNKFNAIKLSKTQVSGDWMNGSVAPVIDSNNGELIVLARPGYSGEIVLRDITDGYRDNYYKWDGKPNWENCD